MLQLGVCLCNKSEGITINMKTGTLQKNTFSLKNTNLSHTVYETITMKYFVVIIISLVKTNVGLKKISAYYH